MKRILGLAAALACAVTLLAQGLKESIQVNVVEVPVTVIDSNGNPVRGLTAANFELYDNGTKRDITGFDAIDFAALSSTPITPLSPLNPNARRRCTPAPSRVGFALMSRLTGRIDITPSRSLNLRHTVLPRAPVSLP